MSLIHPHMTITDLRIGKHRTLIRISGIERYIRRRAARATDVHVALYRYGDEIERYSDSNKGSTAGYSGVTYGDAIPFEFDGEDIAESCRLTKEVIAALKKEAGLTMDSIRLFYSGNRSIHMVVPVRCFGDFEPRPDFHKVFFEIALRTMEPSGIITRMGEFNEWKSDHLDLELYKPQHMLRFPNTLHEKTMRFKVAVSEKMLDEPDQIIEESQDKRPYPKAKIIISPESMRIGDEIREVLAQGGQLRGVSSSGRLTFKKRTNTHDLEGKMPGAAGWVLRQRAYVDIWKGGMVDGESRGGRKGRRQCLLALCGHLKYKGFAEEEAIAVLELWNSSHRDVLDEDTFYQTIESAYLAGRN
jgi:hypothetical protein